MVGRLSPENENGFQGQANDVLFICDGYEQAQVFDVLEDGALSKNDNEQLKGHVIEMTKPYLVDVGTEPHHKNQLLLVDEAGL